MAEENRKPPAVPNDVILTEAQKQLRDEILDAVINREAHEAKARWMAEWSKKTLEEQAEIAYDMFCTAAQRENQMAKRINEGNAEFWKAINSQLETQRQRSHGGRVKAGKSPKHDALKKVRKDWEEWQKDKATYKTKAAFARDMLDAYPDLTSQKGIEDKCREWEKAVAEKV